jgi:hypothetical protein
MTADVVDFPRRSADPVDTRDPDMGPVPFWYALAREQQAPQEFAEDAAKMLQLYSKLTPEERRYLHELIKACGRIVCEEEPDEEVCS